MRLIGNDDNVVLVDRRLFDENQRVIDEGFAGVELVIVFPSLLHCLCVLIADHVHDVCCGIGDLDCGVGCFSNP